MEKIIIKGVRVHNLKNISVEIPKNAITVLTGLSGSGKSSLAFETIHKEGQRQYLESMGMVTDYLSKPDYDSIEGLSPTISINQYLSNRSPRSTVGTETEIYTYLRVLFAKIGYRPCRKCGKIIPPFFKSTVVSHVPDEDEGSDETYSCPHCTYPVPRLTMAHFSFNKLEGACPECTGLGTKNSVILSTLFDETKSLEEKAVPVWDTLFIARYLESLVNASHHYGYEFDPSAPIKKYNEPALTLFLYGNDSPQFRKLFPKIKAPDTTAKGKFEGIVTNFYRRYSEKIEDKKYREKMEKSMTIQTCPSCNGDRLNEESKKVTVKGKNIIELQKINLSDLKEWLCSLYGNGAKDELKIIEPVYNDLKERIERIIDTGIDYLTLDREINTLSCGEAQRLRLSSILGSKLTGVTYVFDEPTMGLHQKDTDLLISFLRKIKDLGNTIIVIEHDIEFIKKADYVVDIGPGAGIHGGQIVASGAPCDISGFADSLTGKHLSNTIDKSVSQKRKGNGKCIRIEGACEHNLKNINVDIPLGMFVSVAGVSGSGKSSLIFDTLDKAARESIHENKQLVGNFTSISGLENFKDIITISQTSIGKSSRSNAATYTDAFSFIRKTFSELSDAAASGFSESHFSFNVAGGRCDRCEGAGVLLIKMHFLPDVEVKCPHCHGKRYKPEVLSVKYRNFDISQILEMDINEAIVLFEELPQIYNRLRILQNCGLGYLHLGQPSSTLSGGEAQRVKLAKELGKLKQGKTLYLLDEPTTGLHPHDVRNLIKLLNQLVDQGNSVIVVEHNMDIIASSDWIIDMGPCGGNKGGYVVAFGSTEMVMENIDSATGRYLRSFIK